MRVVAQVTPAALLVQQRGIRLGGTDPEIRLALVVSANDRRIWTPKLRNPIVACGMHGGQVSRDLWRQVDGQWERRGLRRDQILCHPLALLRKERGEVLIDGIDVEARERCRRSVGGELDSPR